MGVIVAAILVMLSVAGPADTRPSNARFGAVATPLRLAPIGGAPIAVRGLHGYYGPLELQAFGDGIALSNNLSLERYLWGLNEVPLTWPTEALRAQVVAARTYALWTLAEPRAGSAAVYGFDICATVQCQVFSGADVVATAGGARWRQAVTDTQGQVLLYNGGPILARYHSTSGGRTLDNSQAFPTERDYPYLQSVTSTTEKGSPLYRWRVRFRLQDLRSILTRAGWWDGGRLAEVRTIPSRAGRHYPDVLFDGTGGNLIRSAEELRVLLRAFAPQMFPGKYPSPAPTTSGQLPETFPSNRIIITTRGPIVRVVGAGWGHGVGMSQWGAHGLALHGGSYAAILGHYYSGVTLGSFPAPPRIEVGLQAAADTVTVTGAFRLIDGRGRVLVKRALGTWAFDWAGSGAVAVRPPRGFGLPLDVGIVRAPRKVEVGEKVRITIALSRPARVQTVTRGTTEPPPPELQAAGRRQVAWRAPASPGTYAVRVRASTGSKTRRSEPVKIEVRAPPPETRAPVEALKQEEDAGDSPWWLLGIAGALLAFAVSASVLGRIRR
ncbi:MAG: SpoIID/LytB domain-containing protein, partial [Actinomycetota bacterium]